MWEFVVGKQTHRVGRQLRGAELCPTQQKGRLFPKRRSGNRGGEGISQVDGRRTCGSLNRCAAMVLNSRSFNYTIIKQPKKHPHANAATLYIEEPPPHPRPPSVRFSGRRDGG